MRSGPILAALRSSEDCLPRETDCKEYFGRNGRTLARLSFLWVRFKKVLWAIETRRQPCCSRGGFEVCLVFFEFWRAKLATLFLILINLQNGWRRVETSRPKEAK